ncbi:MAG: pyridine nucleotide-disulfide oxidoreductase, partial [Candidatus Hadarchaeales archaeon]
AAEAAGFSVVSGRVRTLSKPYYFPGAEPIIMKMIVEKTTRKIIGAQIIGEGAAERANLLAFAITHGIPVDAISRMEYCYAPPVNDCIEPLILAAESVVRKL